MLDGYGYGEIVDELANLGYRSKNGKPIGKNTLNGILQNRKYVGDYIYNKSKEKDCDGKRNGHKSKPESEWIVIPDAVPAIVSRDDFDIIQKKMASRRHTTTPTTAIETYLLKGKIRCGVCGGAYIGARRQRGKNGGYFVHYGCGTRFRMREAGCTNKQLSKPFIEKFVVEHLAEYVFNEDCVSIITAEYNDYLREQSEGLHSELRAVKQRLSTIEGDLSKLECLERKKTELEAKQLRAQQDKADDSAGESFDEIKPDTRKGRQSKKGHDILLCLRALVIAEKICVVKWVILWVIKNEKPLSFWLN